METIYVSTGFADDCEAYHLDEAKERFECGLISHHDWVWQEEVKDWTRAAEFFERLKHSAKSASQRILLAIQPEKVSHSSQVKMKVKPTSIPAKSQGWLGKWLSLF